MKLWLSLTAGFGLLLIVAGWADLAAAPVYSAGSTVKVNVGPGHGSGAHLGNGYVITAAHVVDGAKAVSVTAEDGVSQDAEILWANAAYDVALLRIKVHDAIASSPLSCRVPQPGEAVIAKGNPASMEFLTFRGFVSGKARTVGPWRVGVPVDLTVIGGMSGGPIFDETGNVIGLSVGHLVIPIGFGGSWVRAGIIVPGAAICDLMVRG